MLKQGPLDLSDLAKRNYLAIVQHFTQQPGVVHQVTLRADKVSTGLIRLGETPGDELLGWNYPQNIQVIAVLGEAIETEKGKWECRPILEEAA